MGSTSNRLDDDGNEKVQCRVCHKWWHRLDVHVLRQHGLSGDAYRKSYPGAPLRSAYALTLDSEAPSSGEPAPEGVFVQGLATLQIQKEHQPDELERIPQMDPDWILDANDQSGFEALAIAMQDDENTLIVGPAGIGKSTMVMELAARCRRPVLQLNGWGEIRTSDVRGGKVLVVDEKTGQTITTWEDSELIMAAERGWWVLIDEFDSLPPHITFLFHPLLEKRRHMRVQGRPDPEVNFHEDFRIVATANTLGFGDETGLYAGTNVMNQALLDRFGTVVKMDYPSKATERQILINMGLSPATADSMLAVVGAVRAAVANRAAVSTISTRRLVNWAKKAKRLRSVSAGADFTVIAKAPPSDQTFLAGLIQRHFGKDSSL